MTNLTMKYFTADLLNRMQVDYDEEADNQWEKNTEEYNATNPPYPKQFNPHDGKILLLEDDTIIVQQENFDVFEIKYDSPEVTKIKHSGEWCSSQERNYWAYEEFQKKQHNLLLSDGTELIINFKECKFTRYPAIESVKDKIPKNYHFPLKTTEIVSQLELDSVYIHHSFNKNENKIFSVWVDRRKGKPHMNKSVHVINVATTDLKTKSRILPRLPEIKDLIKKFLKEPKYDSTLTIIRLGLDDKIEVVFR